MNIFTAESLNELLREAEKIMEGYNSGEECNNMDNSVQGKFTVGCLICGSTDKIQAGIPIDETGNLLL